MNAVLEEDSRLCIALGCPGLGRPVEPVERTARVTNGTKSGSCHLLDLVLADVKLASYDMVNERDVADSLV